MRFSYKVVKLCYLLLYGSTRKKYFTKKKKKTGSKGKYFFPTGKKLPLPEGILKGVVRIFALYDYFLNSNGANSFKQRRQVRNS